ncbi:hypothetical protein [Kitasatospora sp. NPDC059571]|uniref:hypothetical protein n=1 Tax=Kitasatospora sp. NPDC059571 TaxID=3346871 RepID=UPI003680D700
MQINGSDRKGPVMGIPHLWADHEANRHDWRLLPASAQNPTWRAARVAVLMLIGAMPVTTIPLSVFGLLPLDAAARFIVLPFVVLYVLLVRQRSASSAWAVRGLLAGLLGVAAYDAMRLPLVAVHLWPDFIPRLGGWILGTGVPNIVVGYTWRWLGDGGGIGIAFFMVCGVLGGTRLRILLRHPIALSIGYGIFVWSGLLATVVFSARGAELLFRLTPASFVLSLLGHLVYGSVLGVYLRRALAKGAAPILLKAAVPAAPEETMDLVS